MPTVVPGPDPSELYTHIPPEHLRALQLSPEHRAAKERRAKQLRANALNACPECLYDLGELFNGDQPVRCPKCAVMVSRPSNTLIWSSRSFQARCTRFFARWSGFIAGVFYWLIAASSFSGSSDRVSVIFTLLFCFAISLLALLIIVPICTAAYLWARNPKCRAAVWIPLSMANLLVQVLIFWLMAVALDFVSRTY